MSSVRVPAAARSPDPAGRACGPANASDAPVRSAARTVHVRRLGGYEGLEGPRELVALARRDGSTLLLDRDRRLGGDARVVGVFGREEPPGNARLLCRMYVADATRGRCRRLVQQDLLADCPQKQAGGRRLVQQDLLADCPQKQAGGVPVDAALVDVRGWRYAIRLVACGACASELRWVRWRPGEPNGGCEALSLRDVVGALQAYEPARAMTGLALTAGGVGPALWLGRLRAELVRLDRSRIVLNRGLREAVAREVSSGVSMSEIAMRCGRVKRDRRGRRSGETSWLARRIGLLADAGQSDPTPWVHSQTLALIARDGLGVAPFEVEL